MSIPLVEHSIQTEFIIYKHDCYFTGGPPSSRMEIASLSQRYISVATYSQQYEKDSSGMKQTRVI